MQTAVSFSLQTSRFRVQEQILSKNNLCETFCETSLKISTRCGILFLWRKSYPFLTRREASCVNLACFVASLGYKTLLVDFDPQANATSALGVFDKKIENSIYDALCAKDATRCVRHGKYVDFIPSSRDLAGAELELANEEDREYVLSGALEPLKDEYDFVFIDCAPSINLTLINALCASSGVIVPLQCEYFALEGLNQLLNTVRLVKTNLNPNLRLEGILLTMCAQTKLSREVECKVRDTFKDKVFETTIPRNVRLAEAPGFGMTILEFDKSCSGAKAYEKLAKEYISKFKE